MVANWVVGKDCSLPDLAQALKDSIFDVTVVTVTKEVTSKHLIFKYLENLHRGTAASWLQNDLDNIGVLSEKAVVSLESAVWLVIHRAKVKACKLTQGIYRSGGQLSPSVIFGHVELHMNTDRQRMQEINVGAVVVRGKVNIKTTVPMLSSWIKLSKIAVLCGFFGKQGAPFASSLAKAAGAVGDGPCHQVVRVVEPKRLNFGFKTCTHPSFLLLFGYFREMSWPEFPDEIDEEFKLGQDIIDEMVPLHLVPRWDEISEGSSRVPNLGNIKMKPVDLNRWIQGCFQTCVWMGTSIPSKRSQAKSWKRQGNIYLTPREQRKRWNNMGDASSKTKRQRRT